MARRGPVLWSAAAVLAGAAAAASLLFTVVTVYRLHVPLPYWDEWYSIIHFRRFASGPYGLADLANQHNEHRPLFPRLVFFADELAFGLSGSLNATVTLLLQAANAAILVRLMLRRVARPVHRALLAAFVLLLLFTLRQEQNFSNGFQLQFVGVFTAAALAGMAYAAALDRLAEGRGGRSLPFFAMAALGCVVSAYTMANGLVAGVVLAVVAALRRAPGTAAATLALSGLLMALFFHIYVPGTASLPLSDILTHPLAYPRFITAYLGTPFGSGIRTDQALGTAGLLLAGAAAWRVATERRRDGSGLALLCIMGFMLATAAATAYGRLALGTAAALESRYATPALIFWCAAVVYWFPVVAGAEQRGVACPTQLCSSSLGRRAGWCGRAHTILLSRSSTLAACRMAALGALMAALGLASCWFEATAWPDLAARSVALRNVSDSLVAGLYDADTAILYENTPAAEVAAFVPFLREHRLAAFADPAYAMVGHPIGPVAAAGTCEGSVAAVADPALGPGGVRLSGTAFDLSARRAPRRILVADGDGTVVGVGSASLPGQMQRLWSGYAKARVGDRLRAYARRADGSLCDLGGTLVGGTAPEG